MFCHLQHATKSDISTLWLLDFLSTDFPCHVTKMMATRVAFISWCFHILVKELLDWWHLSFRYSQPKIAKHQLSHLLLKIIKRGNEISCLWYLKIKISRNISWKPCSEISFLLHQSRITNHSKRSLPKRPKKLLLKISLTFLSCIVGDI